MSATKRFDWPSCVRALTVARLAQLANERGYRNGILTWLHERHLIGLYRGCIAFPVHDGAGVVIGCHCRNASGNWFYTKGTRVRPLVIGDLATAARVHVLESQWDAFELCDKTKAHVTDGVAINITRGAENGAKIKGLIGKSAEVFAWPQNDPQEKRNAKTGKTPAEKWLADVASSAGVKVRVALTLHEHKDLNEWGKAGATADDYACAMKDAEEISANHSSNAGMPDDETLMHLAALSPLEYERARKAEAKRLDCRGATLDKLVAARREKPAGATLQGRPVNLANVEPWPHAVNGADVLDAIAETFTRYVALPVGAADALALWCAHAHVFLAFVCSPRLNISSPEKGCGKTVLRDVVALYVPRPVQTENLSAAVLFRLVAEYAPTILADECDTWLEAKEELRGLLNAGHRRGAKAYRCEGDANEVRAFAAYAPAVLCGIGTLPGTLHDRSIVIRLQRAKPGEVSARFDPRRTASEQELCRKLARWCADNFDALEKSDPELPANAFNRAADNWRPLFAVAHLAGGEWPQRAADAVAQLTRCDDADAQSLRVLLLEDIRRIFGDADKLASAELVEALAKAASINNIYKSGGPCYL